jgi:hypothetical protein
MISLLGTLIELIRPRPLKIKIWNGQFARNHFFNEK